MGIRNGGTSAAAAGAPQYHGLMNQGATCYLNSVLQVLFMSTGFREAVQRFSRENPDSDFIDLQLKDLFEDLQKFEGYTYKITKKLAINDVHEQRDAAEYYERILNLASPDSSEIFHGTLTQRTSCSQCSTQKDTDGPFWLLPLVLVDSDYRPYNVEAGIEEHFRKAYLNGANQMYCDGCDCKSDAIMSCVMKRPPEVLTLLLKRFDLNYYMMYVKNNCVVEVPYTLQIPQNLPCEVASYELYAVIDHDGDLRGGHYTATIKSLDDGRWYRFNDSIVKILDKQPFEQNNTERSDNVYLLFYRKSKDHVTETCSSETTNGNLPPEEKDLPEMKEDKQKMEGVEDSGPNEDTAMKDNVSVGSGDHVPFVESMPEDSHLHKNITGNQVDQRDVKNILEDHEKVGQSEAEDQTEQIRSLSGEELPEDTLKEQDLEEQDVDNTRKDDVHFGPGENHDVKAETIDRGAEDDGPNKKDKEIEHLGNISMGEEKVEQTEDDGQVEKKELSSREDWAQERVDDQVQNGEDVEDARKDDVVQSGSGENHDVKPEIFNTGSDDEGLSTIEKKMRVEVTKFTQEPFKKWPSRQQKVTDNNIQRPKAGVKNVLVDDQEGRQEEQTSFGLCSPPGNGSEECETQPEKTGESFGQDTAPGPRKPMIMKIIEEEATDDQGSFEVKSEQIKML